jgi:hypothetical protein
MILCGDDFLWLVRLLNSNWDWVWVQIRNLKIWPYHLPQQNGQPMIPGLLLLIISAISLGISNRVRTVRTCILDKELHNFAGLDPHFCWLNHMKSPFLPVKSSFVHSFPLVKVPIFQIVVEPFHWGKSRYRCLWSLWSCGGPLSRLRYTVMAGWWFGTFLIFHNTWDNLPID